MGIKSLNPFLKKKCPEAFVDLPYSYFRGKRIAIDSDNVLHKLMSRSHKEIVNVTDVPTVEIDREQVIKRWIKHVRGFVDSWLKAGVTLVFVFDGEYIDEKTETQAKRRQDRQKLKDSAEEYKQKVLALDSLERTPEMITNLRKKMSNMGYVAKEDKELIMGILSAAGLPVIKAAGEGEALCATLCIEGKVEAVYSRDTDIVAFGCPISITEEAGYTYNPKSHRMEVAVKAIVFKPILSALNMSYAGFLDLCIMAGCDFNDSIPHLGLSAAYKHLLKYGSIENIVGHVKKCKNVKHPNCIEFFSRFPDCDKVAIEDMKYRLKYVRCREIFTRYKSKDISQDSLFIDINKDLFEVRDRLSMYGVEDWIPTLMELYSRLPSPSHNYILKIPSLSSSRIKLNIVNNSNNNSNNLEPDIISLTVGNISTIKTVVTETEEERVTLNIVSPQQKSSPKQIKMKTVTALHQMQIERYMKSQVEI